MSLLHFSIILFFGLTWASYAQDNVEENIMENYEGPKIFGKYIQFRSPFAKNKEIHIQDPSFLEDLVDFGQFLKGYLKEFPIKCLSMLKNHPLLSFNLFFWNLTDKLSHGVPKEQWNLEELFDLKQYKTVKDLLEGNIKMCEPMNRHIKELMFNAYVTPSCRTKAFSVIRNIHETFENIVRYAVNGKLMDERFEKLQEQVVLDKFVMKNITLDRAKGTIDHEAFLSTFEEIGQFALNDDSDPRKDIRLKGILTLFIIYAHLSYSKKGFPEFPLKNNVDILFFIIEVWSLGERAIDQVQIFNQFKRFYQEGKWNEMMRKRVQVFYERFNTPNKKRKRSSSRKLTIPDIIKKVESHLKSEDSWILNALAVIENSLKLNTAY